MTALLDNPLVQSALLPFVIALVLGLVISVVAAQWRGLALPVSFYLSAFLVAGTQLIPLTSSRKILVLGIAAVFITLLFSRWRIVNRSRIIALSVFAGVAVSWVLWPLLIRADDLSWLLMLVACLVYMLWQTVLIDSQRNQAQTQLLTVSVFAAGVALAATIGASALLGQFAGAIAAASAGLLLAILVLPKGAGEDMLLLPAIILTGLLGLAAVVYASLQWQSLLCLMSLPLVARLPLAIENVWLKWLAQLIIMLVIAAGAVYLAWALAALSAGENYY